MNHGGVCRTAQFWHLVWILENLNLEQKVGHKFSASFILKSNTIVFQIVTHKQINDLDIH